MATLASGAPFSAFTLNDPNHGLGNGHALVPINTALVPPILRDGFALPSIEFDLAGYGAAIPPPFRLPLPFTGEDGDTVVRAHNPAREQLLNQGGGLTVPRASMSVGPPPEALPSILNEPVHAPIENTKPLHKPRVVWTEELHQRFLRAIEAAGSEEAAVPTVILKLMNVSGLSRDNVASHLQKYRLGLKRGKSKKRRANSFNGKQKLGKTSETGGVPQLNAEPISIVAEDPAGIVTRDWQSTEVPEGAAPVAVGVNACTMNPHQGGDVQATDAAEGEGQDCAGSNERDDDGCNDGPSSDDGAGAGSDNRNSACNVSAAEQLPADGNQAATTHGAEAGQEDPCHAGVSAWQPVHVTQAKNPPIPAVRVVANTSEAAMCGVIAETENRAPVSEAGNRGTRSPEDSRSGSNNASKQVGSNGNGVSDVLGFIPTAGSGTGAEALRNKATVSPKGDQATGHVENCTHGSRPGTGHVFSAEADKGAHFRGLRMGSRDLAGMQPVGMPMSLPMPPQVPPANAAPMRAPRLGDHV